MFMCLRVIGVVTFTRTVDDGATVTVLCATDAVAGMVAGRHGRPVLRVHEERRVPRAREQRGELRRAQGEAAVGGQRRAHWVLACVVDSGFTLTVTLFF